MTTHPTSFTPFIPAKAGIHWADGRMGEFGTAGFTVLARTARCIEMGPGLHRDERGKVVDRQQRPKNVNPESPV